MAEGREPQTEPWIPGTIVASRYEILEHLGTGGMGVVYRAKDLLNQRSVALKTIRRDLDDERKLLVSKLLRAEAEALSRVDSDFVVRVFEAHAGSSDGADAPFVAMELLRGRDLERVLKEDGSMEPGLALPLLWQAACGLKAIHAQDIVHRDLKPANLYVKTRDDGTRELKILDFSISRLLDRAAGQKTTMIVGTRGFMAPEQAAGYDVDHRADLFALGQVAHEMLLGPKGDAATPPTNFPMAGFLAWHAKATASDRRERFTSATAAIQELATVLGVPLSAGAASNAPTPGLFETATTVLATAPRRRPQLLLLGLGAASLAAVVALNYEATPRGSAGAASTSEHSPPSLANRAVLSATVPSASAQLAPPQPSSLPIDAAPAAGSALPAPAVRSRRTAAAGAAAPSPQASVRASDQF